MQDFNRYEIPLALRGFLDTAQNPRVAMAEDVQPVVSVGDVTDTPYIKYGVPCSARIATGPTAAKYSWAAVIPGAKVALQVLQVFLTNQAAAATRLVDLRLATAAAVAAKTPTAGDYLVDLAARDLANAQLSSRMWRGDDAAVVTATGYIGLFELSAAWTLVLTFPRPGILLFGDAASALVAQGQSLNEDFAMSVVAREWPLPGLRQ